MRVSRIYVDQPLDLSRQVYVKDTRAHYIRHVLRLKSGDPLVLFNGQGGEFNARIHQVERDGLVINLRHFVDINRNSPLYIEIGLAVTKRDAMDTAIQKVTELGVTSIQPLICDNTSVPAKGLGKKLDHWQQVSNSACEQCGLNLPPTIKSVLPFVDWNHNADLRLIANPLVTETLQTIDANPGKVVIAIGPEGGFSNTEISLAREKQFVEISLGSRILRAETAAMMLTSLTQAKWGDL